MCVRLQHILAILTISTLILCRVETLIETGFPKLYKRPAVIVPYVIRLTKPQLFLDFVNDDDVHTQLNFEDMIGVFILYLLGCLASAISLFALLVHAALKKESIF